MDKTTILREVSLGGEKSMSEDFMCYKREFDYYECSGCGCWKECYNLPEVSRDD